jgi:hypothetical protein
MVKKRINQCSKFHLMFFHFLKQLLEQYLFIVFLIILTIFYQIDIAIDAFQAIVHESSFAALRISTLTSRRNLFGIHCSFLRVNNYLIQPHSTSKARPNAAF